MHNLYSDCCKNPPSLERFNVFNLRFGGNREGKYGFKKRDGKTKRTIIIPGKLTIGGVDNSTRMEELKLSNIPSQPQKIAESFFQDILAHYKEDIISIYLTGSAITKDYQLKHSDINSLIVLKEIKIPFFDFISTLGKHYGKKRIRAPLIMTKDYINRSLEVFPIEFLEMNLIHQLVYGDDVLKDIKIEKAHIRLQCERELKGKLQHLCQCYIKSMGNRTTLTDSFVGALSGFFPLFRAMLFLYDQKIPTGKADVLYAINECCNIDMGVFTGLLDIKSRNVYPSAEELREIFRKMYHVLDVITKKVDEFTV